MPRFPSSLRENWYRIQVDNPMSAPDENTAPHFTVPPVGADSRQTVGFALVIGGFVGPFNVTPYRYNPTGRLWAAWDTLNDINSNEELITYDVGGGSSFFIRITNISANGTLILGVTPLT